MEDITKSDEWAILTTMINRVSDNPKTLAQMMHRFYVVEYNTNFGIDSFDCFVDMLGLERKFAMNLVATWSTVEKFIAVGEPWVSRLDWRSIDLVHKNGFSVDQMLHIRTINDRTFSAAIEKYLSSKNG